MHLKNKVHACFLVRVQRPIDLDDVGEGVEGHRISGDATGSWF